jgi:hypothetical protein
MSRKHCLAVSLALVLALAALVGGCGGDSNPKKSSTPVAADSQQQVRDDAATKASARTAVTELEACYVDQAAYTGCKPTQAGVTAKTTGTGYVVTATSKSGNAFVLTKDADGALARTCTTSGKGGCPAAGTW